MISLFKPSNFEASATSVGLDPKRSYCLYTVSEIANRILNDWLESEGKVVYTHGNHWSTESFSCDTHQAILIDAKPIEKKKCDEHFPQLDFDGQKGWFCASCNKKLKATWSEIEGD